ncbi:hypothetical protein HDV06_000898 [Boothiomyces sp. JEL0866]|nr:hypothetical protein HDV06_000898 [Boothiomyces sp. JEL0866]
MTEEELNLLRDEVDIDIETESVDAIDKLNECISKIGMGQYQWRLFFLCGMGWAADNMWFQGLAVILTPVYMEFKLSGWMIGAGSTSTYIGAMIGALLWGYVSDKFGRQPAFLWTLIISAVGGIFAALSTNIYMLCASLAFLGCGIGGALFLEFIPQEYQSLLTLLSLFWPVGQVVTSLIAWTVLPKYSCELMDDCGMDNNKGWRIVMTALSCISILMILARIFVLHFHESPKNLIARGKYQEAVDILNSLAKENNVQIDISAHDFARETGKQESHLLQDYAPLFKKEFCVSTIMIILIWVLVAVGYNIFNGFLPKFLQSSGLEPLTIDETYRNYVIVSIAGVPGSILGTYLTDTSLGRKGTMSVSTLLTAAALFLFTVLKSNVGQLIAACSESFLQNIMYGIIYTYTPEVFPTFIRGKAVGLASASGRLTGAFAPVLAGYLVSQSLTLPLYLSASLIGMVGVLMIFLPIETRGSAAR